MTGDGRAPGARFALPALLAGAAAIGFAPILVRLSDAGPVSTAFWRMVFAVPALWLWQVLERRATADPVPGPDRRGLIVAGLCLAADLGIWHWSIAFTTVANATLLANFAPIFVVFFAWTMFGERVSRGFLLGLGIALTGAVLLMGGSVRLSLGHVWGDVLGVVTAAFYAGYILAVGRLRGRLSTATIMLWTSAVTAVALLPVALVSGEPVLPTDLRGWLVVVALGLGVHAGGQSLIAFALAHLPAAFSAVTLLLQPAIAAGLAWVLFGEALEAASALGAAVILAGIVQARRASR